MRTKEQLLSALREQLALEYNCGADAFLQTEAVVTSPANREGRRRFSNEAFFFKMVTLGGNAVISADERTHAWLKRFAAGKEGHWLFEHPHLREMDVYLQGFGKRLNQTHHMFLPLTEALPTRTQCEILPFEREDLRPFYPNTDFPNALAPSLEAMRPDMLAFAAKDGGQIIGVAGASADAPLWWQIGVDVHPAYRKQGLAAHLVSLLRGEVEKRGCIPYYGTSLSNLASKGTALHCGFRPAWVETETVEVE